jgi:biopolymer transport protein ExbD
MKISPHISRRPRIELIPLIDILFFLLIFLIYCIVSMAVHRSLPVHLPASSTASVDQRAILSVTLQSDGSVYVNKVKVPLDNLRDYLRTRAEETQKPGVLLFADRDLSYQKLFVVLDEIRMAGISQIALQAEKQESQ